MNENYVAFDKTDTYPGDWYDANQIQQVRHGWTLTNKTGQNPWGGEWHVPESLFRWNQVGYDKYKNTHEMSPPQVPEIKLCNAEGFAKKTFSSFRPWWTKTLKNAPFEAGVYALEFVYFDDNFIWQDGKTPPPDPLSFEVRLVAGEQTSPWRPSDFLTLNTVEHVFTLTEPAQIGFEMRGRWGLNNVGVFAHGFTAVKVNKPKIVIMKTPQNTTRENHLKAAGWSYDNYRRTLTASTDDMLTMLRAGNDESFAVIVDPASQPDVLIALGDLNYETLEWYEL